MSSNVPLNAVTIVPKKRKYPHERANNKSTSHKKKRKSLATAKQEKQMSTKLAKNTKSVKTTITVQSKQRTSDLHIQSQDWMLHCYVAMQRRKIAFYQETFLQTHQGKAITSFLLAIKTFICTFKSCFFSVSSTSSTSSTASSNLTSLTNLKIQTFSIQLRRHF